MTFIFDFDYTLFNTDRLKKAHRAIAQRLAGISDNVFDALLHGIRRDHVYRPSRHCQLIGDYANCDPEMLHHYFYLAIAQAPLYLYDDVKPALTRLRDRGHTLYVVSFGDRDFQREKIEQSGVRSLVDDVVCVEELHAKHHYLPVGDCQEFVSVNDNPVENDYIAQHHTNARVIQMVRPNASYDPDPRYEIIHDLHDIQE